VAIRRGQQKERGRLLAEIEADQKKVTSLNEERAPIAAEVRKVEAEVGPIKYIAQFVYGETNEGLLEKAVTWVIIILIVVFDPLAVILLLSSQVSFQNFRERENSNKQELPKIAVDEPPTVDETTSVDLEWKEQGPIPMPVGPLTTWTTTAIHEPVIEPAQFKDPGEHPADTLEYEILEDVEEPVEVVEIDNSWTQPELDFNAPLQEEPPVIIEQPKPVVIKAMSNGDYVEINGQPGIMENARESATQYFSENGHYEHFASIIAKKLFGPQFDA
jgi:hypothetical protein